MQFFVPSHYISDDKIVITGTELHHIYRVLRKKQGDVLNFFDEKGKSYQAMIETIAADTMTCSIIATVAPVRTHETTLYQCLPKARKLDAIIEKCTELGVAHVVPVLSENVVVKLDEENAEHKMKRWNAIAHSSAKQSGNTIPPTIHAPIPFDEALMLPSSDATKLIPYEYGICHLRDIVPTVEHNKSLHIFVGSEGGFSPDEIARAEARGWQPFRLRGHILRVETAATSIIAIVHYELGLL